MAVVYRFVLHSFDELPKRTDLDEYGTIICLTKTGKAHCMSYTEEFGWNTFYSATNNEPKGESVAMSAEEMRVFHKGWLRPYEIGEENWFDQTVEMLEEVQGLQREYESEQRNDDKSDALDEFAALLDQAKDFAEVFS